jgi:GNAT superfamily N-acetyltransferase
MARKGNDAKMAAGGPRVEPTPPPWRLRVAQEQDIPAIAALIAASVRGLSCPEYSPEQRERALETAFTVDTWLIADGTYFVAAIPGEQAAAGETPVAAAAATAGGNASALAGCGGWGRRKTLCGGDLHAVRDDSWLDPATDAAKIRAIFVHPRWARQGLGAALLRAAEAAAAAAGFHRLEMGATLTGAPLYRRAGYTDVERLEIPIGGGLTLPVIVMAKDLPAAASAGVAMGGK